MRSTTLERSVVTTLLLAIGDRLGTVGSKSREHLDSRGK